MDWTRRSLLVTGMSGALAPSSAWAYPADAAMWVVRDGAAKVFLFGDGGPLRTPWRSQRVEAALNESSVFWKETPDNGPESSHVLLARGVDPTRPLSTWLTAKDRDRVAAAAVASGITLAVLERFRPWLAAVLLENSFNDRNGFKAANAADQSLEVIAKAGGKPIRTEFPDIEALVAYASGFSRTAEIQSLLRLVDEVEAGASAQERRNQAWATGDLSLEASELGRWRRVYPELVQEYVLARNRRWPARIRTMLEGGGTTLVVVGDGHLVGPDSLLEQLAASGLRARRV
jgi:hypothetical protein